MSNPANKCYEQFSEILSDVGGIVSKDLLKKYLTVYEIPADREVRIDQQRKFNTQLEQFFDLIKANFPEFETSSFIHKAKDSLLIQELMDHIYDLFNGSEKYSPIPTQTTQDVEENDYVPKETYKKLQEKYDFLIEAYNILKENRMGKGTFISKESYDKLRQKYNTLS